MMEHMKCLRDQWHITRSASEDERHWNLLVLHSALFVPASCARRVEWYSLNVFSSSCLYVARREVRSAA